MSFEFHCSAKCFLSAGVQNDLSTDGRVTARQFAPYAE